ncbi:MAG: phage holin family protein [Candidatus Obscuribacterales bacterium]|nr:phage holin family protein [Candidatus Obscuribacterales bacterium]
MKLFLIRLALIACAFYFVFPMIPGVQFHGNFLHAIGVGLLFGFLGWVVESIAIALSALLTIGTLGMALLVLIPAWIVGFFLLPALVLRCVADVMPDSMSFSGWEPAIWGGLLMLVIGVVTGGGAQKRTRRQE